MDYSPTHRTVCLLQMLPAATAMYNASSPFPAHELSPTKRNHTSCINTDAVPRSPSGSRLDETFSPRIHLVDRMNQSPLRITGLVDTPSSISKQLTLSPSSPTKPGPSPSSPERSPMNQWQWTNLPPNYTSPVKKCFSSGSPTKVTSTNLAADKENEVEHASLERVTYLQPLTSAPNQRSPVKKCLFEGTNDVLPTKLSASQEISVDHCSIPVGEINLALERTEKQKGVADTLASSPLPLRETVNERISVRDGESVRLPASNAVSPVAPSAALRDVQTESLPQECNLASEESVQIPTTSAISRSPPKSPPGCAGRRLNPEMCPVVVLRDYRTFGFDCDVSGIHINDCTAKPFPQEGEVWDDDDFRRYPKRERKPRYDSDSSDAVTKEQEKTRKDTVRIPRDQSQRERRIKRHARMEVWWKYVPPTQRAVMAELLVEHRDVARHSSLSSGEDLQRPEWDELWIAWTERLNQCEPGFRMTSDEWKYTYDQYRKKIRAYLSQGPEKWEHKLTQLELVLLEPPELSEKLFLQVRASPMECLGPGCPRLMCVGASGALNTKDPDGQSTWERIRKRREESRRKRR